MSTLPTAVGGSFVDNSAILSYVFAKIYDKNVKEGYVASGVPYEVYCRCVDTVRTFDFVLDKGKLYIAKANIKTVHEIASRKICQFICNSQPKLEPIGAAHFRFQGTTQHVAHPMPCKTTELHTGRWSLSSDSQDPRKQVS